MGARCIAVKISEASFQLTNKSIQANSYIYVQYIIIINCLDAYYYNIYIYYKQMYKSFVNIFKILYFIMPEIYYYYSVYFHYFVINIYLFIYLCGHAFIV